MSTRFCSNNLERIQYLESVVHHLDDAMSHADPQKICEKCGSNATAARVGYEKSDFKPVCSLPSEAIQGVACRGNRNRVHACNKNSKICIHDVPILQFSSHCDHVLVI